jgi:hypothetical protein
MMKRLGCARAVVPIVVLLSAVEIMHAADIWGPNPLVEIREGVDYAEKADPKASIRLVGVRNGAFSGQVVLLDKTAFTIEPAVMSDLKLKEGDGVIPASAIEVRYALPNGVNGIKRLPKGQRIFDTLSPVPRKEGIVQPVWITVNVAKEAAPGEYAGTLSVMDKKIPVDLTVIGWMLPPPVEFTTFADFIESPESVALHYKVPMWSDRHFEMIGSVYKQLAKVGNKTVYLNLVCHSNLGNAETIVRWTRKGDKYVPDLTAVKRLIDVVIENGCRPQVVVLYLYEGKIGGGRMGTTAHGVKDTGTLEQKQRGVRVTLYDPETKKTEILNGPCFNSENAAFPKYPDDTIAFWKPVVDGIREHLEKHDIPKETMMYGNFSDFLVPFKNVVECLKKLAPYIRWIEQTHGSMKSVQGQPVGYTTTVWNARFPKEPKQARYYGWKLKPGDRFVAFNDRDIWKPCYAWQLVRSRLLGELDIVGKQCGFGRMCADFWPVLKGGKGKRVWYSSISRRYRISDWHQLNMRATPYLSPSDEGALTTIRFEMVREGLQECEARIFIEKALIDEASRAKLGESAVKFQAMLDERVGAILGSMSTKSKSRGEDHLKYVNSDWQGASAKLFSAAADVAKVLGVGE